MEEIDQEGLLKTLKGYPVGERVILGHFGTVQTLLALIFGAPVTVHLIDQREKDSGRYADEQPVIHRNIQLRVRGKTVAWASSLIPKSLNHPDVVLDVVGGGLGLGQILFKHNIPTKRRLTKVERDTSIFSRTYIVEGEKIFMEIHEVFSRKEFQFIGWV